MSEIQKETARPNVLRIVRNRDLGSADRVHSLANFAEGMRDALHGLAALQETQCDGVLALIDVHIENLRELATDLEARS